MYLTLVINPIVIIVSNYIHIFTIFTVTYYIYNYIITTKNTGSPIFFVSKMQPRAARATLFRPRPAVCRDQECLGQGACSSVYRGRQGDKEVALKRRGERGDGVGGDLWWGLMGMSWDEYCTKRYIYIYWIYTVTHIDMRFGDLGASEHGVSFPNYDHSKRDDDESMESGVQYLFRLTNPKRKIMDI